MNMINGGHFCQMCYENDATLVISESSICILCEYWSEMQMIMRAIHIGIVTMKSKQVGKKKTHSRDISNTIGRKQTKGILYYIAIIQTCRCFQCHVSPNVKHFKACKYCLIVVSKFSFTNRMVSNFFNENWAWGEQQVDWPIVLLARLANSINKTS